MKKMKCVFWLNAIFYIVLWTLLLFFPGVSLTAIIIVFGIESLLSWILSIVFIMQWINSEDKGLLVWMAILQIILWVVLMFFPGFGETVLKLFVVLIGIFGVIKGLVLSIDSFQAKNFGVKNWYWMLIFGLALVLIWLFLITNSYLTLLVLNGIIWIWLILSGISIGVWAFHFEKTYKAVKKQINKAIEDWTIEVEISKK